MDFPSRKVWFKVFGCQMNYHDTERMLSHLASLNFSKAESPEEADLLIFNTCGVRALANTKFYSLLGEMKPLKKKNPDLKIGVCGCVAQVEGQELLRKYRHLDFAFGTDVIDQINDILFRVYSGENKVFVNSQDRSQNYSIETRITHGSPQAFVNIVKGCNNFCSYCIVPYTRGPEVSRRMQEVVDDVKRLVEYQGIQEVILLGQNVNSFGKENGEGLAGLLSRLDEIEGLELIRYMTSHPKDLSDELIHAHGILKKLAKHVHLPVQSGSNTVLQRMGRGYTREHFLSLCEKLRRSQPEIALTSDFIVGFPDETDEEFQDSLRLLDEVQFDLVYSYKFSPRAKTKAASMPDSVPKKIKEERLAILNKQQLKIQEKIHSELVGKTFRVLVEGESSAKGMKRFSGRTSEYRNIHFEPEDSSKNYQWHWMDLKVNRSTALSCYGEIIRDLGKKLPGN